MSPGARRMVPVQWVLVTRPPQNFSDMPLAADTGCVDQEGRLPAPPQITDEDLVRSAPAVRALLVSRLEAMWRPIEVAMQVAQDPALPVDPRLLEIGIRLVDKEAQLYGITRPKPVVEEERELEGLDVGVDRRAMIEDRLKQIEERFRKAE